LISDDRGSAEREKELNGHQRVEKGVLLAGGRGSRLYPLSRVVSKQLLPVHDKPMVYYPLATLMAAGIREILLVSTPQDHPRFQELLGDGRQWGVSIEYRLQQEPKGIAQAILLSEDFIGEDPVVLILGDNLFCGDFGLDRTLVEFTVGARVFALSVEDPGQYGVVELDSRGQAIGLEEKPSELRSCNAVPGLYIYDETVVARARKLTPSQRGELEITDLNRSYLADDLLQVERIGGEVTWFDAGSHRSLLAASAFVGAREADRGTKIACLEEVAYRSGHIDLRAFQRAVREIPVSPYRDYLDQILADELTS